MSETSWDDRREWEERLIDGLGLTTNQAQLLIADADEGERAVAVLEALEEHLKLEFGVKLVDMTTDDDDGEIRIDLIQIEAGPAGERLKATEG